MKVLCTKNSLFCEIYSEGLFIHIVHDIDDWAILDYLEDMDIKTYAHPCGDRNVLGVLVYPDSIVDALVELSAVYDLVIQ